MCWAPLTTFLSYSEKSLVKSLNSGPVLSFTATSRRQSCCLWAEAADPAGASQQLGEYFCNNFRGSQCTSCPSWVGGNKYKLKAILWFFPFYTYRASAVNSVNLHRATFRMLKLVENTFGTLKCPGSMTWNMISSSMWQYVVRIPPNPIQSIPLQEGLPYQNGWIFGKVPTVLHSSVGGSYCRSRMLGI